MHCRAHLSSRGLGHRLLGVSPEPVSVPRWVRGQEAAELVKIPGAPAGFEQKVVEADDPGEPGAREPFSASRDDRVLRSISDIGVFLFLQHGWVALM
jgi:hypothetical protein